MANWIVDDREPNKPGANISEEIQALDLTTDRQRLDVGDFVSYDCDEEIILVSRKAGDLFTSVFDGHFSDELNRCINLIESLGGGGKLFWLQEGIWSTAYPSGGKGGMNYFKRSGATWFRSSDNHSGSSENALPNMQVSLQSAGIYHVTTGSLHETALMLAAIYHRGQDGWPSKMTSKLQRPVLHWGSDSKVQRLMALWPHLKEQAAIGLIHQFGTITQVMQLALSDEKQLLSVQGVGKTGLQNFKEAIQ